MAAALISLVGAAGVGGPLLAEGPALVIEDTTLITMTEAGVLAGWDLLIRDGLVAGMAPRRPASWPEDAQTIDGAGKFVLPALHDLHVHIFDERDLEVYALHGIGVVRNMDGWAWHLGLAAETDGSESPRARLVTTGGQYERPGVASVDAVAAKVREEFAEGFDWIKAYDDLDLEQIMALAEAASDSGMAVTGHLPDGLPAEEAIATGAYADVAHVEELLGWYRQARERSASSEETLEAAFDRLAGTFKTHRTALVSTLIGNRMILEQRVDPQRNLARPEVGLAAPLLQVFWRSPFNQYTAAHGAADDVHQRELQGSLARLVAELHRRGVVVLGGTDAPNPTTVPADSLFAELELLVEAGLSPDAALRSVTVRASDHLGDVTNGRLQVGARADLLLAAADPLVDISNLRQGAGLVIGGHYFAPAAVRARLEELTSVYADEAALLAPGFDPTAPDRLLAVVAKPTGEHPGLSAQAITSIVWFLRKVGAPRAAQAAAERLVELYPGERSQRVLVEATTVHDSSGD